MLKKILVLVGLTISTFTNAEFIQVTPEIQDHGIYTRDLITGLEWLDVTETTGSSYNDIEDQLQAGGAFEGWRYADYSEFEALVQHFGYLPTNSSCPLGNTYCDMGIGDYEVVELMINTLGDTGGAYLDQTNSVNDIVSTGSSYTYGLLGSSVRNPGQQDIGLIYTRNHSKCRF